jgi:hypothetical protein
MARVAMLLRITKPVVSLKRIFFILFMFIAVSLNSAVDVHIDANGAYLTIEKGKNLLGGGGAFGIEVFDNLSVLYRGLFATAHDQSAYFGKMRYDHMMHLAGAEYRFPIPYIRIGWRNAFMVGYSRTRYDFIDNDYNFLKAWILNPATPPSLHFMIVREIRRIRDSGLALAFWSGLQLDMIPCVSPFIDAGIHKSFYTRGLVDKNIVGFHLMFGVRLSVRGGMGGHEAGY